MNDQQATEGQEMFQQTVELIMELRDRREGHLRERPHPVEDLESLDSVLNKVRDENPRIFGQVAMSVRQCIVAAIRKGYSAVGGRETVGGLRSDLLVHGLLEVSKTDIFDAVINETYDTAYTMGVATELAKRDTETDWLVELFKAFREAKTLWQIFVEPRQSKAEETATEDTGNGD